MRTITSFILLVISVSMLAQAELALTTNFGYRDTYIYKNSALISKILLTLYSDEWYEEHLLSDHDAFVKNTRLYLWIDACGYITLAERSRLSPEIKNAILKTIEIIEQEHFVYYGNRPFYDWFIRVHKSFTPQDLRNIIRQEMIFEKGSFELFVNQWFFLLPGNRPIHYEFYKEAEVELGREPLSYLDWLKQKIDYYLTLPIESSLDYGITNEVFCPENSGD